ncbi:arginyltransferase [Vibrio sp. 10N.286.49.B3]|uniref:arginyltransferase n=1 Tax=Vibrio sp. 10N.286.49.B3 TaxID=1880855 RepID=UPI000C84CE45|nr:arginyltransferase [Vibrio sp. 10N.286.49.B3]PMH44971.1 arginyltransferase [Vibrio sp. 10N.286.49.B3]
MSTSLQQIKIGLTDSHPCNYLPTEQERVAVALMPEMHTVESYEILLANGFRRSGETIYKPHCESCSACHALRIPVPDFVPSKSQKRIINQCQEFRWELKDNMDEDWFDLYSRYISARHASGSMYPPKESDFFQFSQCSWLNTKFLHIYQSNKLIAVAVTDLMAHSASAFYTFFDPEMKLSMGTVAILFQLDYCKKNNKQWLYLGYQIDECPAMNYKVRFKRHQRLVNQRWQG